MWTCDWLRNTCSTPGDGRRWIAISRAIKRDVWFSVTVSEVDDTVTSGADRDSPGSPLAPSFPGVPGFP